MRLHRVCLLIPLFVLSIWSGTAAAQAGEWEDYFYLLYKFEGSKHNQVFGQTTYLPGDLNLDGYGDIMIGAYEEDANGIDRAGRAYVYSGFDGTLHYTYTGESKSAECGRALGVIEDTDGDGYPEFLIGAHGTAIGPDYNWGKVYQYSGKDGSLVYEYIGEKGGDGFGIDLEGIGDANSDGVEDFIVGAIGYDHVFPHVLNAGAAYVYSGATRKVLYKYTGIVATEFLGYSVCRMGDVDQDNLGDFAYLKPNNKTPLPINTGIITVHSGSDGSRLKVIVGQNPGQPLNVIEFGQDVNADGRPDLLVGQPYYQNGSMIGAGRVMVYSGKDWSIIHEFAGTMTTQGMGNSISRAGDIDKDQHEDVLVGASGDTKLGINDGGGAFLFSGKDGTVIAQILGEVDFLRLGTSVHGGEDVNSDGLPDLIIGTSEEINGVQAAGSALVYVSKSLQASNRVQLGGDLELNLRVPAMPFGFHYLAFSLDTEPGIPIGTRTLPLTWDALFSATLGHTAFTGNLDSQGEKQIIVKVPNDPYLSGLFLYSAFVIFDQTAPKWVRTISNPEEIEIL